MAGQGALFQPSSDVYVRIFLYLLYTLIKLDYTHTHKEIFASYLHSLGMYPLLFSGSHLKKKFIALAFVSIILA